VTSPTGGNAYDGDAAEVHASGMQRDLRKQRGAWLTPPALAQPTADRTLAPLLASGMRPLRIVDPAVGGGAFLIAALRTLRSHGASAAAASECLFGIDIDPVAAELATTALQHAAGDEVAAAAISNRVHGGDGLTMLEPGTFDAVLTNPPWETLQGGNRSAAQNAELRRRFVHQGRRKLYTYRLFVERAFQLLRPGGRLGLIVPASLWFDREAEPLRRLLLEHCDWQWLYGFENKRQLFAIDPRYRFGVVIATKGGSTARVQVAFGRTDPAAWATEHPQHVVWHRDELRAASPTTGTFVEVDDRRDLELLVRMHQRGQPLLGPNAPFVWRQGDFNMTGDREQFVPRAAAEHDGYGADDDGVFRRAGHPDLLPLWQGAMIQELQPNVAAHAGGSGHGTRWIPANGHRLQPAWLIARADYAATATPKAPCRLVHRTLSNASNERTMIACLLGDVPTGNSLGVLTPRARLQHPVRHLAATAAVFASLPFDWALRLRLGGINLNGFVLADCVLPPLTDAATTELAMLALRLSATATWQRDLRTEAQQEGLAVTNQPPTPTERAALQTAIDVVVGNAFGLTPADVAWIVRDCTRERLGRGSDLPAKGFWRVDRALPPAARRPNRWLAAVSSH
jgi:hypothetical protein